MKCPVCGEEMREDLLDIQIDTMRGKTAIVRARFELVCPKCNYRYSWSDYRAVQFLIEE